MSPYHWQLLAKLCRSLLIAIALLTIISALLLSGLRASKHLLNQYPHLLPSMSSALLGAQLHAQGMWVDLNGWQFHIHAERIDLVTTDNRQLHLEGVVLHNSASWPPFSMHAEKLAFSTPTAPPPKNDACQPVNTWVQPLKWLRNVQLDHTTLQLDPETEPLHARDLRLAYYDGKLRVHGLLDTLEAAQPVTVRLNITPGEALCDWSARLHMTGRAISVHQLHHRISELPSQTAIPVDGQLDLDLWQSWDNGHLERADVSWHVDALEGTRLRTAQGTAHWIRQAHGWQLTIGADNLTNQRGDQWQDVVLQLNERTEAADTTRWHSAGNQLPLDMLADALQLSELLSGEPQDNASGLPDLSDAQLYGQLTHWQWYGSKTDKTIDTTQFSARLDAVGLTGKNVTLRNITGNLSGDATQIKFSLDAHNAHFSTPEYFEYPLDLATLQGDITLEQTDDQLRVQSTALEAQIADGHVSARFNFTQGSSSPPYIDAEVSLQNIGATEALQRLPRSLAPITAWLEQAELAGTIREGTLLVKGDLVDFPDIDSGLFEAHLNIEQGYLTYADDFPSLHDASGQFHLVNHSLSLNVDSGYLRDSPIEHLVAYIPNVDTDLARLTAAGSIRSSGADLAHFLAQRGAQQALEHIIVEGQSQVLFDATVPVTEGANAGETQFDASILFDQLSLAHPQKGQVLNHIQGRATLSDTEQISGQLTGQLLGHPVKIYVSPADRGPWSTQVFMEAPPLPLTQVFRDLELPFYRNITGSSPWHIEIGITPVPSPEHRSVISARAHSNLIGTRVNLPVPLGKKINQPKRLSLSTDSEHWQEDGQLRWRLGYGRNINADIRGAIEAASIHFGPDPAVLSPVYPWYITGRLRDLNIDLWIDEISHADLSVKEETRERLAIDMQLIRPRMDGLEIPQVQLSLSTHEHIVRIDLNGPQIIGHVLIPTPYDVSRPIDIHFDQLDYALIKSIPNPDTSNIRLAHIQDKTSAINPEDIVPFNLYIKQLFSHSHLMGELSVNARHQGRNLHLDPILLKHPHLDLQASASWNLSEHPVRKTLSHNSSFELALTSDNLQLLLADWGDSKAIQQGATTLNTTLHWPDKLLRVDPPYLSGDFSLAVSDGTLPSSSAGFEGRVISLLALSELSRHLQTGFKDVVSDGLPFKHIKAEVSIKDHKAYLTQGLMDGSFGKVEVSGYSDLLARMHNFDVKIVPSLDSTIPTITALTASSTALGVQYAAISYAVIWVARNVFGTSLFDGLATSQHKLSGSWDNPHYE